MATLQREDDKNGVQDDARDDRKVDRDGPLTGDGSVKTPASPVNSHRSLEYTRAQPCA